MKHRSLYLPDWAWTEIDGLCDGAGETPASFTRMMTLKGMAAYKAEQAGAMQLDNARLVGSKLRSRQQATLGSLAKLRGLLEGDTEALSQLTEIERQLSG